MVISERKKKDIQKKMEELKIFEKDIEEKFILASKKGGQKVQKTHSAVQLKHLPTNLMIKCEKERDQITNRFIARKMLCELYEEKILNIKTKKQLKDEKIKKQKKRRKRKTIKKEEK